MQAPQRILVIAPSLMPSVIIGVLTPLGAVGPEVEFRVRFPRTWTREDILWSTVVVFSRNIDARSVSALRAARQAGRPTVFELDDSFFDAPADVEQFAKLRDPQSLTHLYEFLVDSTRVHGYSARVVDQVTKLGGRAFRAPTYFDDSLRMDVEAFDAIQRNQTRPRVVFPTVRQDTQEMENFTDRFLAELVDSNPDLELHLWRPRAGLQGHAQVVLHVGHFDYQAFIGELQSIRATVGLALLGDTFWEQSKTNNKFREFAGLGIPGVYSKVGVYEECVDDGVHGLLRENVVAAWVDAVNALIADGDLRVRVGRAALDRVRDDFGITGSTAFWSDALHDVSGRASADTLATVSVSVRAAKSLPTAQVVSGMRTLSKAVPAVRSRPTSLSARPCVMLSEVLLYPNAANSSLSAAEQAIVVGLDSLGRRAQADIVPVRGRSLDSDWLCAERGPNGIVVTYDPAAKDGPRSRGFAVALAANLVARQLDGRLPLRRESGPALPSDWSIALARALNTITGGRQTLKVKLDRLSNASPRFLVRYAGFRWSRTSRLSRGR